MRFGWHSLLVLILGLLAPLASASAEEVIPCDKFEGGEPVTIPSEGARLQEHCDVTLQGDLVVTGAEGAKLNLTPEAGFDYGLILRSDGHSVTFQNVELTFNNGHAVDVIGKAGTGNVTFNSVRITDTREDSSCKLGDKRRFGLILYRNGQIDLTDVEVRGASEAAPAVLQAGIAVIGFEGDPKPPAKLEQAKIKVKCGLAFESVRRGLRVENSLVEAEGPCDMRPKGLRWAVDDGVP